ncbi:MAG TPA: hypothetical protein VGG89_02765 [Candidatus Baltobacteraceae bacterium]|jgi:hypothetical protein
MATAMYLTVSIGLLLMLFWKYASSERARRRRGWSFDRAERAEDREGAMVRSASNSRGWR